VTTAPFGAGQGLVALLKDLTRHKLEQEQALLAARLADVGRLAAGVAHEINTPLASIALRAESLLKSAEDPRLQAIESFKNFPRYLKSIDEETFRCKKIIGALLEFSSSRKRDAHDVDLNLLAERAADLLGHQMKLKQVALALELAPELPPVPADDGQLRQVLVALLINALDATPAGGHVAIKTQRDGERVILAVSDDGAGIPEDVRDRIFTPFFTTKPLGKGTGLGLAICHGIVSAHGGEIRVESEVGHGTRVSVALPLAQTPPR
jgi:two-component system NtrC family sensor kinase